MRKMSGKNSGGGPMQAKTNHSPKATDASTHLPRSPSVNADAVRSTTAKQPKVLGPREA